MTPSPSRRVGVLCDESFSSFSPYLTDVFKEFAWDAKECKTSSTAGSTAKNEAEVVYFLVSTVSSLFTVIRAIAGGNFSLIVNLCSAAKSETSEWSEDRTPECSGIPPALVAHLLDQHHIPYTGCRSETLSYSLDLVWMMMWYANIPLPPFCVIRSEAEIPQGLARLQHTARDSLPMIVGKATSVWGGADCYTQTLMIVERSLKKLENKKEENKEDVNEDRMVSAVKHAMRNNGALLIFRCRGPMASALDDEVEENEEWEAVDMLVWSGVRASSSSTSACAPPHERSMKTSFFPEIHIDISSPPALTQSPYWGKWESSFKGYGEALMKSVLYGIGIAKMTFSVRKEAVLAGSPSFSSSSFSVLSCSHLNDCALRDVIFNPSLLDWVQKSGKNEENARTFFIALISNLCSSALLNSPSPTFAVRLHKDPRQGYRLCAARNLHKGEVVFEDEGRAFAVVTRPHVQANWNEEQKKTFTEYAWPLDGEGHVYAIWEQHPSRWRPINHSCDPTCVFAAPHSLNVIAAKEISQGEDLTMDYATFCDSTMKPFLCLCGSEACRGWIQADEKSLSKYGPHAWFRRVPAPVPPLLL